MKSWSGFVGRREFVGGPSAFLRNTRPVASFRRAADGAILKKKPGFFKKPGFW